MISLCVWESNPIESVSKYEYNTIIVEYAWIGLSFYFSAKALQTILVLTGKQDLHKRWSDSSEYLTVDWTEDSAKEVLEAWQRKFTEVYIFSKCQ